MNESLHRDFRDEIREICRKDLRYDPEAYFFLREALNYTITRLKKPAHGPERHISGSQLLEGIRRYAISEFGPAALTVLNAWGITKTDDFGELVFRLVESGQLSKTNEDKKEDFAGGYDFFDAFRKPYLPRKTGPAGRRRGRSRFKKESPLRKHTNSPENSGKEK